jgi:putative copper resistance protein D
MFYWAVVTARLLQFTSILVLFGSSLFYLYGFNPGAANVPPRRWTWPCRVLLIASFVALLATIMWVMAETALLTDDAKNAVDPEWLWTVAWGSRIGRVYLLRFALLIISLAALSLEVPRRMHWITQAIIGGLLVASLAWSGHGARDKLLPGGIHLGADILHLFAAGVWIGALVPLGILILLSFRTQTTEDARATYDGLESFSGIGLAVVAVLVLTGAANSWFLIGLERWRALFTTSYGLTLVFKLGLFGIMLLLAAGNRFFLSPRLGFVVGNRETGTDPINLMIALRSLRRSVLTETVLAFLVLAAVALLGTLEPPVSISS